MGEVEQDGFAPSLGILFEVAAQRALVDRCCPDPRTYDGLDPIDQTAAHHGIAALHAELDRAAVEGFVALRGVGFEEAHVLHQPLMDDGIDLGEADPEGLVQPDGVLDRLALERRDLVGPGRPSDLKGECLDPFGDLTARYLDDAGLVALAADRRLEGEEQSAESQEVEERGAQHEWTLSIGEGRLS